MTRFIFMLISAACVSMFTDVGFAQEDATSGGTLRGQITDITLRQNPIEGVEVKIVAQDGGKEWTTKTDADGNYKHAGLPAGRYLISISKNGYDRLVGNKSVTIVDGGEHFVPLKMAQKGNIEPFFEVQKKRKDIAIKQEIKPRVGSLLQGTAESVSRRYDLDTAAVDTLRLSILEAVEIALKRDGSIHLFAKAVEGGSVGLLKVLLSRLDCKVLFAKHLSEAHLQDYVNFTEARQQLDQQAVARWITAALDRELSLTADQREKIVGLLHGAVWNRAFLTSMSVLGISSQKAGHLVHYRLKISLDNILSEAQSKVWHGLVNTNANRDRFAVLMPEAEVKVVVADKKIDVGEIVDPNKKRAFIRKAAVKPVKIEKEVNVVINEVAIDPPGRLPPWVELNADTAESQAQMMQLAEAKLVAHTELLGPLTERAARRLALVAKGVAQQYTEARDKTHDAMDELSEDEETGIDITEHPMYQQAIKDVLSEEAFAQYSTYQAEREVWYQQVLRDLVVACMDTQLILDDTQRKQLETTAADLTVDRLKTDASQDMFYQLLQRTNHEMLSPWQQETLTFMHTGFEREFGDRIKQR